MVPHDCYGGSWRLFNALAKNAFDLITCDLTDPRALAGALEPARIADPGVDRNAVNPLLRITDLLRDRGRAQAGALAVVDNTFLSPALQTPIADFDAGLRGAFDHQTSTATATWSAARWSPRELGATNCWPGGRIAWA